tara:strand:- start:308 stop:604 length:297 start_codon:yes stop_codon:yes gene_type:complete
MSGELLIGIPAPKREMSQNKIERSYEEMSYNDKENAGFPLRYYDLSVDQKFFVDNLFETCYNVITTEPEVQEEIENLKDLVKEIEHSTTAIYNSIRGH